MTYRQYNLNLIYKECSKLSIDIKPVIINKLIIENNINDYQLDVIDLKNQIKYYIIYYRNKQEQYIENHYQIIHFVNNMN